MENLNPVAFERDELEIRYLFIPKELLANFSSCAVPKYKVGFKCKKQTSFSLTQNVYAEETTVG